MIHRGSLIFSNQLNINWKCNMQKGLPLDPDYILGILAAFLRIDKDISLVLGY